MMGGAWFNSLFKDKTQVSILFRFFSTFYFYFIGFIIFYVCFISCYLMSLGQPNIPKLFMQRIIIFALFEKHNGYLSMLKLSTQQ